jgi:hypothetical protein
MEEVMFDIWTPEGTTKCEARHMEQAIRYASLGDRRELLSLLRARICLSCGEPRTGTFTACPMCRSTYTKDP